MQRQAGWLIAAAFVATLWGQQRALADDGTYNSTAGDDWSVPSRWLNGIVADGADSTATFVSSGYNSPSIINDGPRTIGNIVVDHATGYNIHIWICS